MAEFPCLPIWTDAWIADTAHLDCRREGLYWRLVYTMWRTPGCRLPNDPDWLARHLRLTAEEILLLPGIINEFCQTDGNWLRQKRLGKVFLLAFERRGRLSDLGKRRKNKKPAANGSSLTTDAHQEQASNPKPTLKQEKASSFGESQQPPPVEKTPQQDPSANGRATALPEGAPARPPPTHKLAPSPELVATVANQLGYPHDLTPDEKRLIAIEPNTWTPARILAQRNRAT